MKKLALAIAAFIALAAAPAFAADMGPPLKAPLVPLVLPDWTGFYLGVNGGYGWGNWNSDSLAALFPDGRTTNADPDVKGWFGGFTAGYNWHAAPEWVVGIEGDFDWSGEKASDSAFSSLSFPNRALGRACDNDFGGCTETIAITTTNEWKKDWFATVRARAGYLIEPTWLVYGTGGIAFAEARFSTTSTATLTVTDNSTGAIVNPITGSFVGAGPISTSVAFAQSQDVVGFAVGGGVEKLLTPDWSLKAEYLFMEFGTHTFLSGTGSDTSIKLIENIVRVGVDYHFH